MDSGEKISGLYFHIPFCKKICPFCSFTILKDRPEKHALLVTCFKEELENLIQRGKYDFSTVSSIYFGGGTPSRLGEKSLVNLITWLQKYFPHPLEWSIEVNPEDVTLDYANLLHNLGFTRVSIGVQSFNDSSLEILERNHKVSDARNAIKNIQKTGIRNINLDLLYGYPDQSFRKYQNDVQEALSWNPMHISAYCISIEPKTAVNRRVHWHDWQQNQEEVIYQMYEYTVSQLREQGLLQYEVSNFCYKNYESVQNMITWTGQNYLGFGPGAHSFVTPHRWGNKRKLSEYSNHVEQSLSPLDFLETPDPLQRLDEDLLIGLRCKTGINPENLFVKYNLSEPDEWKALVARLEKQKLIYWKQKQLLLSSSGLFISDEIALTFSHLLGFCIVGES